MHVAWTLHVATSWEDVVRATRTRQRKPLGLVRPRLPAVGTPALLSECFPQSRRLISSQVRTTRLYRFRVPLN
jgi:hypothetical protein